MAFVSGLGGGGHVNANYFDKRNSVILQQDAEDCGCVSLKRKKPKKRSKIRLMKERIRQFSIWFFENEDSKEVEHVRRRLERKKKRKMLNKSSRFRPLRWLYGFDVILWIFGAVFTLCSTVKAFGKHTDFYKARKLYRLLGPGLLLAAVLILFLATALKHRLNKKHNNKPRRNFYIVQKNKKTSKCNTDIKDPDNDSGNEADIEMTDFNLLKELETITESETFKETDGYKLEDIFTKSTRSGEQQDIELYNEDTRRNQNRRAWAKTKWMRMDIESGDSFESEDVLDLVQTRINEDGSEEIESRETQAELPSNLADAPGQRRIKRFKPLSGGCFTAQSSIRSQTSEISFASTTSESAPLVRK